MGYEMQKELVNMSLWVHNYSFHITHRMSAALTYTIMYAMMPRAFRQC